MMKVRKRDRYEPARARGRRRRRERESNRKKNVTSISTSSDNLSPKNDTNPTTKTNPHENSTSYLRCLFYLDLFLSLSSACFNQDPWRNHNLKQTQRRKESTTFDTHTTSSSMEISFLLGWERDVWKNDVHRDHFYVFGKIRSNYIKERKKRRWRCRR